MLFFLYYLSILVRNLPTPKEVNPFQYINYWLFSVILNIDFLMNNNFRKLSKLTLNSGIRR
jgi:hypothetical protein